MLPGAKTWGIQMTDKPNPARPGQQTDKAEDPLAPYFAALRKSGTGAPPGDALMARVLADAEAEQAARESAAARARPAREGALRSAFRALGGWPAVAGLSAATVAGVWFGVNPPEALAITAQTLLQGGAASYAVDLDPDATYLVAEGAF